MEQALVLLQLHRLGDTLLAAVCCRHSAATPQTHTRARALSLTVAVKDEAVDAVNELLLVLI
jgi:hypothetical protein